MAHMTHIFQMKICSWVMFKKDIKKTFTLISLQSCISFFIMLNMNILWRIRWVCDFILKNVWSKVRGNVFSTQWERAGVLSFNTDGYSSSIWQAWLCMLCTYHSNHWSTVQQTQTIKPDNEFKPTSSGQCTIANDYLCAQIHKFDPSSESSNSPARGVA